MKTFCLTAMLLVGGIASGAAQMSARAFVDRTSVPIGQRFVLSVEVSGDQQTFANPNPPDLSAFARFLGSGSSQQMSFVNGRTSVSRTLQFTYLTTAEGSYTIPAVSIDANGTTLRTEPIAIEVGPAPAGGQPGAGGATGIAGLSSDDLFVRATADRRVAYPNQPVLVEYRIYTRVNVRQYELAPVTAPGTLIEQFPLPQSPVAEQEVIDGRRYVVATLRKMAVFPTSAGEKTIDPVRVTTGIEVRGQSRDPFDSFFRMGSLLGRVVEYEVYSNPITIDVQPLPDTAPDGFTGHVGSLSLNATIDSAVVERDNAITFSLRVDGVGNLKTLPAPDIDFPDDFEVYPPDITSNDDWQGDRFAGSRRYDYVLIPRAPGRKTIPSVQMAFFDDALGTYRTVRTAPLEIAVTGDPVDGPIVTGGARREVRTLRDDIRFIETGVPSFRPIGTRRIGSPIFWVIFAVPVLAVGGALAARRQRDRLEGDQAYARRRRSSRRAQKRLAAARAAMSSDAAAFYVEADKALTGFLGDRINVSEAGFIRDEVLRDLRAAGVADAVIDEYFACIDTCAAKRFAPAAATADEMEAFLERAANAMTELERSTP